MNNNLIYCSSVQTTGTGVILIPNRPVKNLVNGNTYGLIICNSSVATANLPIFIQTEIGNIPVLCKAGNTMYANQLDKRVRYPIIYGNLNTNYENGQFIILSCVSPRSTIASTPGSI